MEGRFFTSASSWLLLPAAPRPTADRSLLAAPGRLLPTVDGDLLQPVVTFDVESQPENTLEEECELIIFW